MDIQGSLLGESGLGLEKPEVGKDENKHEKYYQSLLAQKENGQTEVSTPYGRIDVLTSKEVIEVKFLHKWKEAFGQVIVYGLCYPQHGKRVHLIGGSGIRDINALEIAAAKLSIRVTWSEREDFRYKNIRLAPVKVELTDDEVLVKVKAMSNRFAGGWITRREVAQNIKRLKNSNIIKTIFDRLIDKGLMESKLRGRTTVYRVLP